ncbi:hypothetical protein SPRG_01823 [Saprolegnia parasitica CBS 223.65]|uniref:SAM-dependent MTase RsmB/NOP-type domain-containing protein n=1 Tax=Saprolegnia parasitica (strain CBS 223.65) TaxID=695850 RepID=A0A067D2L0_SAPPC|nr:hypothetical protein SPRG_01823 [Saprolegnia parasitica CBS 223.65]KDO33006.1 hypothetical protein SPRG_01823 [Saprolegnia parasitica CBS 223.65]|eukprot:XP_012195781.1 hypothetical protein SPRG_01823 [Saprolegnia parasitica CBS 223.65]
MELPATFRAFLVDHGIEQRVYDVSLTALPRYFRIKDSSVTVEQLQAEFPGVQPVPWLKSFYAVSSLDALSSSRLYTSAKIYGMEASSGFAVAMLDPQPGDHVLDLCCAPGAKLAMLADVLGRRGSITGVDYSKNRISACRSLLHKYDLVQSLPDTPWRCRLFHADGRRFAEGTPTSSDPSAAVHDSVLDVILDSAEVENRSKKSIARKRMNKSARARALKMQREASSTATASRLYDKVLVDAECTHDGSLRHLAKLTTADAWQSYLENYLSPSHVAGILELQHDLIRNGFRLLVPGGRMVYSTCSLSLKQNEEIVAAFLKDTPSASLMPIDTTNVPCQPGNILHTVRFTPLHDIGGLFIALFTKATDEADVPAKRQKTE